VAKRNVTIYIDEELWTNFKMWCLVTRKKPSQEIERLLRNAMRGVC